MFGGGWDKTARLLATWATVLLLLTSKAWAGDDEALDLRRRMERLEKQNEELRQTLEKVLRGGNTLPATSSSNPPAPSAGSSTGAGNSPASPTPATDRKEKQANTTDGSSKDKKEEKKDDESKKVEEKDTWIEIGKDLGLKAGWVNYTPWLETDDKSIRIHIGLRTQVDAVFASASERVQFGKGGIGAFEDGVNFRRGRIQIDGWLYEVFDYYCEYDFFQTVNDDPLLPPKEEISVINSPCPTDLWGGFNYLPWIGTLRIGNMKPPIGFEHLTSSRWLDFLERSPLFDTYFNRNNGFEPGIQILNWTEDERLTWHLGLFKSNNTIMGWNMGDGEYQVNGRVSWLPWYQDDGRYLMHLGLGVQYDAPDNGVALLRDRWLLRNGPPTTQNSVALAFINGHNQTMALPEFYMNLGSLSIQAEYLANHLEDVTAFTTQSQGLVKVKGPPKTFFSQGCYIQALYFLTGESRPYILTPLHNNGTSLGRIVPFRNFFCLSGQDGHGLFSLGAWQVGLRYSYNDLSNNGIYGGQINEVTVGLNWFLNPNMKIQWNYDVGYRGQLGPTANSNGSYQGFGTRFAFDF